LSPPISLFLSAGEASGDAYAAALVRELRRLPGGDSLSIGGIGGPKLRAEGVRTVADTSKWGAISITYALAAYPRIVFHYYRVKAALRRGEPGLFLPIDFGYVNVRLARHAKNQGWKVLYFVPPGSWRRDRQGRDLGKVTDEVVTPFPWSRELLEAAGVKAHFFGHPIKQLLRERNLELDSRRETIAVLPGSRPHEIQEILPAMAQALRGHPQRAELAIASSLDPEDVRRRWETHSGRTGDLFTVSDTYGVLARARAALVCSGTATLEAALARTPMVVAYRVGKAALVEARLIGFKVPKYIALPNILLDEPVVPELIQDAASPEAIRTALEAILEDREPRAHQLDAFTRIDALLGPDDAITRTAQLAMQMAGQTS
jgi:lipid-A-disaccharide synthase